MDDDGGMSMSQRLTSAAPGEQLLRPQRIFQEFEPEEDRHGKIFNDPVHKHFRLGPCSIECIDTPQFQRLRDLKQLGLSYYVFPGACHNRFEHSLGVAHLAYATAAHHQFGQPELNVDNADLRVVELAGLCHDLGHGPFSHMFDNSFLRRAGITDWSHEEMSVKVFETIVDDQPYLGEHLLEDDQRQIKDMIMASCPGAGKPQDGKGWLREIVANGRNGLDVDKFDYMARDSLCCGVPLGVDFDRLRTFSMVIEDEICYKWSEYNNVLDVFMNRASLHRKVYGHRKAKAIDHMVVDALLAANPALQITDKVDDPREFIKLDDTILKTIEHFDVLRPDLADSDAERGMRAAQAIVRRLRHRDNYKYCGEFVIPNEDVESGRWTPPNPEELASYGTGSTQLSGDDIIVMNHNIDLTAGPHNPLDNVRFFENFGSTSKFSMQQRSVTGLEVENFQERMMRIYSRRSDKAYADAVTAAANSYISKRFGSRVVCSTPQRTAQSPARPSGLGDPNRKRKLF